MANRATVDPGWAKKAAADAGVGFRLGKSAAFFHGAKHPDHNGNRRDASVTITKLGFGRPLLWQDDVEGAIRWCSRAG